MVVVVDGGSLYGEPTAQGGSAGTPGGGAGADWYQESPGTPGSGTAGTAKYWWCRRWWISLLTTPTTPGGKGGQGGSGIVIIRYKYK